MNDSSQKRPVGILILCVFFLLGSAISFVAGFSLLVPDSFLEPIWRLNPHGHSGLLRIGVLGVVLLFAASTACAVTALGLWQRTQWGHRIAIALIAINLLSDLVNVALGTEPKAIVGVPIAFAILLYLISRRGEKYFAR